MKDAVLEAAIEDYDGLLSEDAVERLIKRWRIHVKYDADASWSENLYAFLDFSAENGYKPGYKILRRRKDQPYSPENCYFGLNNYAEPPPQDQSVNPKENPAQRWNRCVYEYNRERVAAYRRYNG